MSDQPIGAHAMLSDCHTAALVDHHGSVEWWCPPRFDSPSVFGRILDPDAGHFAVRLRGGRPAGREYRDGSLVLETTLEADSGRVVLTDALAVGEGERGHDLGRGAPHVLLRTARCVEGVVDLDVEFAPRFEYGLATPLVFAVEGGIAARSGPVTLVLSASCDVEVDGAAARGEVRLAAGDQAAFAVEAASTWDPRPPTWPAGEIAARLEDTAAAWRSWRAAHQRYEGPYADLVEHSGRVLQGLSYRPTGAMVAAPTTSLPEEIGGERNWDYRYCWMRDAAFTLRALWVAACPDEAGDYLDYLTAAAGSVTGADRLQIMFGIRGRRDLAERELPWLRGWRDSAPVRVGNDAWDQTQHDTYGELLSAVHRLRDQVGDLDDTQRRLLRFLADRAAAVWREPDAGIWEVRGPPQHFVHSKLMCWVALDRALDMEERLDAGDRAASWAEARDEIRAAIETDGWSDVAGAFTQAFGSDHLDAAALLIPIVGFLPPDDDRVAATVAAIRRDLTDDRGLVYRYRMDDGLEGDEGTFLLCSFWLAEVLAMGGDPAAARQVFEEAIAPANDVGLLAEEVDPATGELLGNFPQAFSHVGLINAAWAIAVAEGADSG